MAEDGKVPVGFLLIATSEEKRGAAIKEVARLDHEQVIHIENAIAKLNQFRSSLHVANGVIFNRNDLIKEMIDGGNRYLTNGIVDANFMDEFSNSISIRIANMCSMFRSFIDHSTRSYLKDYGKNSPEYNMWNKLLSSEYDSSVYYRIMYHIRNYVQHYDMPPIRLSINETHGKVSISVDLSIKAMMEDNLFR